MTESKSDITQYDHSAESLEKQAASLAFAMLLFEQEAAHQFIHSENEGDRVGVDKFMFLPSWITTPRAEVISYLESLPCPALMFQTTGIGMVSLILLDELSNDRRRWAQKTLDNHLAGVEEIASQFTPPLQGDSRILLEIRGESHVVSLAGLRFWAQRYNCPAGWTFGPPRQGAPADVAAQIVLISADGRVSPPSQARASWQRPAF